MALGLLDYAVLAGYFAAILAEGFWSGRGERGPHDFFLGGRRAGSAPGAGGNGQQSQTPKGL